MKYSALLFLSLLMLISCAKNVPRKPVVRKTSTSMKESISFNKSLIADEENIFKALMEQDSLSTYKTSSNGFWYKLDSINSNSDLPKFGDKLTYTYEVYDLNNAIIYSTDEIGQLTYFVDQQEIIEGLRNGLKLMRENEIATFLFPSHKVFGYLGDQKKIAINQPLIYKVQLIKINKKNESN